MHRAVLGQLHAAAPPHARMPCVEERSLMSPNGLTCASRSDCASGRL